jgi:precorrin-4 methylase
LDKTAGIGSIFSRRARLALIAALCSIFICSPREASWGNEIQDKPILSISGLVKFPFHFTLSTLTGLPESQVRVTEAGRQIEMKNGSWYRTYSFRGVPLKTLIDMAHVEKEDVQYRRLMDLAIVVRGRNGQAVLSWPEICNADSSRAVIALGADPVSPATKEGAGTQIFPRLVLGNDFYSDRFIDGVFNIEVVSVAAPVPFRKGAHLPSPAVTIRGASGQPLVIEDLSRYPRVTVTSKQSGHDPGYFGILSYRGTPIADILEKEGISPDKNTLLLATGSDGYRAAVSYGELFLTPAGRRIILADEVGERPFGKSGKFNLIFPDDYNADRWVKAIEKIEVVKAVPKARLYVVGVGSGDTRLLTLEGVSVLGKVEAFACDPELAGRFARYMGNKPVLFNPLENMAPHYAMTHSGVSLEEAGRITAGLRDESVRLMKKALAEGKNVALLEYGDPTIFGSWTYWLYEHFRPEDIVVVPGVSAFNAANAAIGKNVAANGAVVLTVPDALFGNKNMVKAVADGGNCLAIFVGLQELPRLAPLLKTAYGGDAPACLVYKAGYSNSEKLVRTTVDKLEEAARGEKEKFLGLIYVGKSLN